MRDDPLYHHTASQLDYQHLQLGAGFGPGVFGSHVLGLCLWVQGVQGCQWARHSAPKETPGTQC